MENFKRLLFIVLCIAFFSCVRGIGLLANTADSIPIKNLEERVKVLEKEAVNELEEDLKDDITELESELKDTIAINLDKEQRKLLWWVLGFLGISTLLGIFALPQYIRQQVQARVDEELREIIRGRSRDVKRMLQDYERENYLLNNKKIYVYGEPLGELKSVFDAIEFDPENIIINNKELLPSCQLILINNQNATIFDGKDDEQFQTIISFMKGQSEKICFLYYCEKNKRFPTEKVNDFGLKSRINFCTNPAQLYPNVLNSLQYQNKLS